MESLLMLSSNKEGPNAGQSQHPIEIVVVGDSRVPNLCHSMQPGPPIKVWKSFESEAKLKRVITMADAQLALCPDAQLLFVVGLHWDLVCIKPWSVDPKCSIIIPLAPNITDLLSAVAVATQRWQEQYKNLIVVWTLPYTPDFFTLNSARVQQSKKRGALQVSLMKAFSKEYHLYCSTLANEWPSKMSYPPFHMSALSPKSGDNGSYEFPFRGFMADGFHPHPKTAQIFWERAPKFALAFRDSLSEGKYLFLDPITVDPSTTLQEISEDTMGSSIPTLINRVSLKVNRVKDKNQNKIVAVSDQDVSKKSSPVVLPKVLSPVSVVSDSQDIPIEPKSKVSSPVVLPKALSPISVVSDSQNTNEQDTLNDSKSKVLSNSVVLSKSLSPVSVVSDSQDISNECKSKVLSSPSLLAKALSPVSIMSDSQDILGLDISDNPKSKISSSKDLLPKTLSPVSDSEDVLELDVPNDLLDIDLPDVDKLSEISDDPMTGRSSVESKSQKQNFSCKTRTSSAGKNDSRNTSVTSAVKVVNGKKKSTSTASPKKHPTSAVSLKGKDSKETPQATSANETNQALKEECPNNKKEDLNDGTSKYEAMSETSLGKNPLEYCEEVSPSSGTFMTQCDDKDTNIDNISISSLSDCWSPQVLSEKRKRKHSEEKKSRKIKLNEEPQQKTMEPDKQLQKRNTGPNTELQSDLKHNKEPQKKSIGPNRECQERNIGPKPGPHERNIGPKPGPHERNIGPKPGPHERNIGPKLGPHERNKGPKLGPHERNMRSNMNRQERNMGPNWGPHERNMGPNWGPHERNMGPNWGPHERNMGPNWGPHERDMGPNWGPHERNMGPNWGPHERDMGPNWGPHERNMGPDWGPYERNMNPNGGPHEMNMGPDWRPHERDMNPNWDLQRRDAEPNWGPEREREYPPLDSGRNYGPGSTADEGKRLTSLPRSGLAGSPSRYMLDVYRARSIGARSRSRSMGARRSRSRSIRRRRSRSRSMGVRRSRSRPIGGRRSRSRSIGDERSRSRLIGGEISRSRIIKGRRSRSRSIGGTFRSRPIGGRRSRSRPIGDTSQSRPIIGRRSRSRPIGCRRSLSRPIGGRSRSRSIGGRIARTRSPYRPILRRSRSRSNLARRSPFRRSRSRSIITKRYPLPRSRSRSVSAGRSYAGPRLIEKSPRRSYAVGRYRSRSMSPVTLRINSNRPRRSTSRGRIRSRSRSNLARRSRSNSNLPRLGSRSRYIRRSRSKSYLGRKSPSRSTFGRTSRPRSNLGRPIRSRSKSNLRRSQSQSRFIRSPDRSDFARRSSFNSALARSRSNSPLARTFQRNSPLPRTMRSNSPHSRRSLSRPNLYGRTNSNTENQVWPQPSRSRSRSHSRQGGPAHPRDFSRSPSNSIFLRRNLCKSRSISPHSRRFLEHFQSKSKSRSPQDMGDKVPMNSKSRSPRTRDELRISPNTQTDSKELKSKQVSRIVLLQPESQGHDRRKNPTPPRRSRKSNIQSRLGPLPSSSHQKTKTDIVSKHFDSLESRHRPESKSKKTDSENKTRLVPVKCRLGPVKSIKSRLGFPKTITSPQDDKSQQRLDKSMKSVIAVKIPGRKTTVSSDKKGGIHVTPPKPKDIKKKEDNEDLMTGLGIKTYWKMMAEIDSLQMKFDEEFQVYRTMPDIYPDYEMEYETFMEKNRGEASHWSEDRKERAWMIHWAIRYNELKEEKWKECYNNIIHDYRQISESKKTEHHEQTNKPTTSEESRKTGHHEQTNKPTPRKTDNLPTSSRRSNVISRKPSSSSSLKNTRKPSNASISSRRSDRVSTSSRKSDNNAKSSRKSDHSPETSRKSDNTRGETSRRSDHSSESKPEVSNASGKPFSVERTLALLATTAPLVGIMGPSLSTMVKTVRERGSTTPYALEVLANPENVFIVEMALQKLSPRWRAEIEGPTKKLLQMAKKEAVPRQTENAVNVKAIAEASQGKDSAFILDLIRTAVALEGLDSSEEHINKLFLAVCELHFDMAMQA